jgi:hypothetical protein
MVDPATAAALAKMSVDFGKAMFGAIAAKRRANYVSKQLQEQDKMISIQWNRKATDEATKVIGTLGDRGIGFSGSSLDLVLDTSFDVLLQKQAQKRQIRAEIAKTQVTGSEQALASLGKGLGDATGTAAEYGVKNGGTTKAQPATEGKTL